ncbi:hypothetical protein [Phocaeicola sp.]|uniref:hypothetical protein n=1 Tax=Phocaeicola sp. TaxID=2773926 RepID=UPI003863725E
MKKVKWFNMLFLSAMVLGSMSCSNDDDPSEGGTGIGSCVVDGHTISYNRGYFYREPYGPANTIEVIFTDYEVISTWPNRMVNEFYLSIVTDESTPPVGVFPYSSSGRNLNTWADIEFYNHNFAEDYETDGSEFTGTYFYTADWNVGYESGDMTVTRDGNYYRIEISNMKLLKAYEGEDGVSIDNPKTTASFVWEGELRDITDWMNEDEYSRNLTHHGAWENSIRAIERK